MKNTMNHRAYFNGQTCFSRSHNYSTSTTTSAGRYRYMKSCFCYFRIQPGHTEFSPLDFLKHLAERVATALSLVSAKTRTERRGRGRHLPQDSSASSSSSSLGRSNSRAGGGGGSVDSYRTEAVEDCIQFIHSSFSRSNSSANSLLHTL